MQSPMLGTARVGDDWFLDSPSMLVNYQLTFLDVNAYCSIFVNGQALVGPLYAGLGRRRGVIAPAAIAAAIVRAEERSARAHPIVAQPERAALFNR